MSNMDLSYPELLIDLATTIGEALEKTGVPPERAADAAFAATEHVRKRWSGQHLYLPKGIHYELSNRDREIWAEFDGHNHSALARKHDLTSMRIYQIIKRLRALHIKRTQPDLFDK
jgi:Mor family transcriptional regulator